MRTHTEHGNVVKVAVGYVRMSTREQAYAAAMAARWRLIDHPHLRLAERPVWSLLCCQFGEKSEKYLMTITQERIDEMQSLDRGASLIMLEKAPPAARISG